MWSSSSTTSTFCGLMAIAMPLEHQDACDGPIRKSARICKKGAGLRTSVQKCSSIRPTAVFVRGPQHDAHRVAGEAEPLAQAVLQVPPVPEVEQLHVVDEQHDRRRLRR